MLNEKSLIKLVRRNWVNIWSLKSIVNSLANSNGRYKSQQFGKDKETDLEFIKQLRSKLPEKYLELLGINDISNNGLMSELQTLNEGILSGSPSVEVIQTCPEKVCKKVFITEDVECPGPITKKIVKEVQVDVCEGNKIECVTNITFLPKMCGINECSEITSEYCNRKYTSFQSE